MAILRNREVTILGRADGADVSPTYTVQYPDLERENVQLSELRLTEDEYKEMTKQNGETSMTNVKKIDDKELQDLRDSQDPEKIKANRKQQPEDITVNTIKVPASEVQSQLPQPTQAKPAQPAKTSTPHNQSAPKK